MVLLPDSASFDLGSSLGVPFLTAYRCLTITEDGAVRLGPGTLQGRTRGASSPQPSVGVWLYAGDRVSWIVKASLATAAG